MEAPLFKRRRLRPPGDGFEQPAKESVDGRVRAKPHVQGQWFTHLYLELDAPPALRRTLRDVVKDAGDVYSLLEDSLHVSLSRPLQLWGGQRVDFLKSIRGVVEAQRSFNISLATFTGLGNDEKTRSFLTAEIGHGYDELSELTTAINNVLLKDHLPTYHAEPRFHSSLAWWLPPALAMPDEALEKLEITYGKALREHALRVSSVKVKIGQDITDFQLLP